MKIQDIQKLYATLPQVGALIKTQEDKSIKTIFLQGLVASAAPMLFASIAEKSAITNFFPFSGIKAVRISCDKVSGMFP